jgi:hypothetical protein
MNRFPREQNVRDFLPADRHPCFPIGTIWVTRLRGTVLIKAPVRIGCLQANGETFSSARGLPAGGEG